MIGPAGAQQCKPSRLPRGGLAPSQNGGPIAIGLHCVQRRIRLPSAPSRRASRRRSFRSIGPSESRHLPSHPPRSQQTPMLRPPRRRHRSANDRVGIRTPGRAEVSPRRARLRPFRISGQERRRVFLPDGSRDPSSWVGRLVRRRRLRDPQHPFAAKPSTTELVQRRSAFGARHRAHASIR
jgi:hypothetical protein